MVREFEDSEFGTVRVRYDARAVRIIFRVKEGVLNVTVPLLTSLDLVRKRLSENRDRVRKLFEKSPAKILKQGSVIETCCFKIVIQSHKIDKILYTLKDGVLNIYLPQDADIENTILQKQLKSGILRVAKRVAEPFLKSRLDKLAAERGLQYNHFALSYGKRRLGVCNTKKRITLSVNLIFYPLHLVDYVILHELAHLTEMNHSVRFHSLCNLYCGGREKELEREFKRFVLPV